MTVQRLATTPATILAVILARLPLLLVTVHEPASAAITNDPDLALFDPTSASGTSLR